MSSIIVDDNHSQPFRPSDGQHHPSILSDNPSLKSKEDCVIIKSNGDHRLYRVVTLPNFLRVLLISDPQTDLSAVSLCVQVGASSDPDDLPGLAHFCEHMVFMGSAKFSAENYYKEFIDGHGGYHNASTSLTETKYTFHISTQSLFEALEIFTEQFVSPLFSESAIEREVNAVDSEFQDQMLKENWRFSGVEKTQVSANHCYAKFINGNKNTLYDRSKAGSIDIQKELLKFYTDHYSSNSMTVAILAKESLDIIESKYAQQFANIPNRNVLPKKPWITPWTDEYLRRKISLVPISQNNVLHLFWPIKDYLAYYKAWPEHYIISLFKNEIDGSLLSTLKKHDFALMATAYVSRPAAGIAGFWLVVNLTEKGLDNIDYIIKLVFQYINMLKEDGVQKWYFEERKDLLQLNFRFQEIGEPYDYVNRLASSLYLYPTEDILIARRLMTDFQPELIKELLFDLRPDNFRYFISSPKVANQCPLIEKYYNGPYGYETIPSSFLLELKNCGLNGDFHLPQKNIYVPTNFDLKCDSDPDSDGSDLKYLPVDDGTKLWFKQDKNFRLPKTFVSFRISSPYMTNDNAGHLMLYMFVQLFNDSIKEDLNQMCWAGLYLVMEVYEVSLTLNFSGFSHKLPVLVEKTVDALLQFTKPDEQKHKIFLEKLERQITNFKTSSPVVYSSDSLYGLIKERYFTYEEKCIAVKALKYKDLLNFIPSFMRGVFVESLVYGNVDEKDARYINSLMTDALSNWTDWIPSLNSYSSMTREVQLPAGVDCFAEMSYSESSSSAIRVYFQIPWSSVEQTAMVKLFLQIIHEPAFSTLRTKKQLGYIVSTKYTSTESCDGICFLIQSTYHPRDLNEQIEEYITEIAEMLDNMTEDDVATKSNSVISKILEKAKSMNEQHSRYKSHIFCNKFNFSNDEIEADIIKNFRKSDVLAFYNTYFRASSEKRRKLSIHVISNKAPSTNKQNKGLAIEDYKTFKQSKPLWPLRPVPKIHNKG